MTKVEFDKRVAVLSSLIDTNVQTESVNTWAGQKIPNVFSYAATSEKCMERNLEESSGRKRKFTFMADLSIGEWVGGKDGVIDTCKSVLREWKNDEKAMAEFILSVNYKSWEHYSRGNREWSIFYSALYEMVRDLVYDMYEGDEEKTYYVWSYLD